MRTHKINNLEITGTSFSCDVDNKMFLGSILDLGFVKAVTFARNINSTKQTTMRIKRQIELFINN